MSERPQPEPPLSIVKPKYKGGARAMKEGVVVDDAVGLMGQWYCTMILSLYGLGGIVRLDMKLQTA